VHVTRHLESSYREFSMFLCVHFLSAALLSLSLRYSRLSFWPTFFFFLNHCVAMTVTSAASRDTLLATARSGAAGDVHLGGARAPVHAPALCRVVTGAPVLALALVPVLSRVAIDALALALAPARPAETCMLLGTIG
jgi:hypothetical protein